jgi:hypothetical protein
MGYEIEEFWKDRLRGIRRPSPAPTLAGWLVESAPNEFFVEADLRLRPDFDDLSAAVWFIAAPGAVGKSTLAREISARTGAVYLDLATAETVAGNYLTGGLAKNGLFDEWKTEHTTVLIDALDEARLRVTQTSFDDFLGDVASLASNRSIPTILFGRVGIIDEAWLSLADRGLHCPVFDIDFFDTARATHFLRVSLDRLARQQTFKGLDHRLGTHSGIFDAAIREFVGGLETVAKIDGSRFAGYAPVLEAAATVLAGVENAAKAQDIVREALQGRVLKGLADRILEREADKLRAQLPDAIPATVRADLYLPEEQLARLASVTLGTKPPAAPRSIAAAHLAPYEKAVREMIVQHPFLDGSGREPSGAVFAAVILAGGLLSAESETVAAAAKRAGDGPSTPNPFLIDFYLERLPDEPEVPPEHVVILYDSLRSRSTATEAVRLSVEGDEESESADVEMAIVGKEDSVSFRTSQAGQLRFGRQVSGVSIDAPLMDVVIGSGNPVEFVAPVFLRVSRVSFECPEIVVQRSEIDDDVIVAIEADALQSSKVLTVPVVRKDARLSVSWPGVTSYPWTHFAGEGERPTTPGLDEALRGFRRLVMAFRSHSKGRLARYQGKVEHSRMTKGTQGVAIREQLLADGILTLEGKWYFLDPQRLGKIAGTAYQDLKVKSFSDELKRYVGSIVSGH